MADDDAAHRRGNDEVDLRPHFAGELLGEGEGEFRTPLGIHEHTGALQIIGTVAPGRQDEMPFQQRSGGPEFSQYLIVGHIIFSIMKPKGQIGGLAYACNMQ